MEYEERDQARQEASMRELAEGIAAGQNPNPEPAAGEVPA